jgi:putative aldouronate transport system permease protein
MQIWRPFLNNVFITVVGTTLHVLINAMAGFALTRKSFPGKNILVFLFLIPMMVPGESIVIPRYILMKQLGLIDSLWSVTINNIAHTFAIFLMMNYFLTIPRSLEESAFIDGAGLFAIFYKIYLPLSTAGLATITLIELVGKWNTLFSAVLYINSPAKYILQQALKLLVVNTESPFTSGLSVPNNAQTAGIVIAILPMLLLYIFIQKYFIRGIYLGAIKG